jgi:hypothetical protein
VALIRSLLHLGTNRRGPACVKRHTGGGMSPREVIACYRLYAAYCLEIAQGFEDRGRKIALLNMAQTWMALADQVERAGGAPKAEDATRGILHPKSDES